MSGIERRDQPSIEKRATVHNSGANLRATPGEVRTEVYQGLVPHPDHVERYEALQPGATDRFIRMAERQSEHRQAMERRHVSFNGVSQILGVVLAGLTVLGGVAAATYLLANDKSISGFVALLAPLGTVAGIFIQTRRSQRAELEAKRNQLAQQKGTGKRR